ncbi:Crp/Fnr family transcriptional regulator [Lacrimispora sp.]|uniref:Crp/Fnr family transcriptional regulator n=1 Tax=Lacrimispora sp. TaxID=2719234 RepID=UPI0034614751
MKLEDLENLNPDFKLFTKNMPDYIKNSYFTKKYRMGEQITSKYEKLESFGIVVTGQTRVINEFENGNIYMLESNQAIDYIGEVTILANQELTSVSIEAAKPSIIFFVPRKFAEKWIFEDLALLKRLSARVAYKLYRSSIENGMKFFYPSDYIFIDYLIKKASQNNIKDLKYIKIEDTRIMIAEEIGMNIKTLNRTISKLRDKDLFSIDKGKILISRNNFENALKQLEVGLSR